MTRGGAPLGEFELIERFFQRPLATPEVSESGRILLGIGDDCAVLEIASGRQLAFSIDTLVEGVHFLSSLPAEALGWRALAVNISDLAAMGADPWCFTLALTLPTVEQGWLEGFSRGLFKLAERFGMRLVGGDTTRGPRSLTIQVQGTVPGAALTRSGARPGDLVLVSGTLGDAAAALRWLDQPETQDTEHQRFLRHRYMYPEPRVALGRSLRGIASAAIDISDGLLADLGHICRRSGVAARVDSRTLPLSPALRSELAPTDAMRCALGGGDDYELCFTVPPERLEQIRHWLDQGRISLIGEITAGSGLQVCNTQGVWGVPEPSGYRHFE